MKHFRLLIGCASVVMTAFLFAGCVFVSTDRASNYGIVPTEEHYVSPAEYDRVYALVKSTGWESTASAVVFDIKGDNYTIHPRNAREAKGEAWVEIRNKKRLQEYMGDVSNTDCQAIALKPCLRCPIQAVGAIYTDGTLVYDCDLRTGIVTFRKPLSAKTDGGGGAGGG